MALKWSKEIETGHHQIDLEHKQLLEKINDFYSACGEGNAVEESLSMLRFLKRYTVTHFAHEERLQEEFNFPEMKRHKLLHKEFISAVDDIEQKLIHEGVSVTLVVEINQKIGFWLINHIKIEDKKLAQYIAR